MLENLFDLSGKVAVVTGAGANGGIGHALALGLSRFGADVIAADIDATGAKSTAQEIEDAGVSALGRGNFAYSISKSGVNQMTRELAVEYASQGIRVNAIAPAQVATETFKRSMLGDPRFDDTMRQRLLVGIPLNRFLEPEEFVGPAVFLCSAAASAVTGVILPVDGGNLALNAGGSHTWPA